VSQWPHPIPCRLSTFAFNGRCWETGESNEGAQTSTTSRRCSHRHISARSAANRSRAELGPPATASGELQCERFQRNVPSRPMRAPRGHRSRTCRGRRIARHAARPAPRLGQACSLPGPEATHPPARTGTGNSLSANASRPPDANRRRQRQDLVATVGSTEVGLVDCRPRRVSFIRAHGARPGRTASRTTCSTRDAASGQGRSRVGERRRDQRSSRGSQVGQQTEALAHRQAAPLVDSVRAGETAWRARCWVLVAALGVPAEVGHRAVSRSTSHDGGSAGGIDGEVQHAGSRGMVAVVARGRRDGSLPTARQ